MTLATNPLSKTPRSKRQGVAMFIVLGAVILFSLLGFVALQLADRDSAITGDLVKIKSQQMAAVSGLNLATTRMQADQTATIAILNAFTPTNCWLKFDDASGKIAVTSSESDAGWWELTDQQAAVKVKILGVSAAGTSGSSGGAGVKIYLESQGRGKDGEIHVIRGMYAIRGLDYNVSYNTNGPANAFQSQGGIEAFHVGTSIDGSIYAGASSAVMNIENNSANIGSLRIAGSVRFTQPITIDSNSIIGGKLFGNAGGSAKKATFNKNLVVRGGMFMDNYLTVEGSFYLSGGTQAKIASSSKLVIGKTFFVQDNLFEVEAGSSIEVGSTTTSGLAIFDNGIHLYDGSSAATVYGDIHIGASPASIDGSNAKNDVGGLLDIHGNLDYFGNKNFFIRGETKVSQNAQFKGAIEMIPSGPGKMSITGNSYFMNGISPAATGGGATTISVTGNTYLANATGQEKTNSYVTFGNTVSMNGKLDPSFASNTRWSFLASATAKTWSYNKAGLATLPPQSAIIDATGVTDRTSNDPVPSWVNPRSTFTAAMEDPLSLGYDADELDLSLTSNPASDVNTTTIPELNKSYLWKNIWNNYQSTGIWKNVCDLDDIGMYSKLPTAKGINCIYKHQKALGSNGILWNDQYLVIHQDGSGAQWNSQSENGEDPGELDANVKVFFIISGGYNSGSIGYWYSNPNAGSVQIVYSTTNMQHFKWKSTFQGFIQFNPTANDDQIFQGGPLLIGAWENKNPNVKTAFNLGAGIDRMSIQNQTTAAITIAEDIATNFATQSTLSKMGVTEHQAAPNAAKLKQIILFSGDKKSNTDPSTTTTLEACDGWIQFERLGEFR